MSVRSVLQTVVFGMVLAVGLATAQATTIWDAYNDFNITVAADNNASKVWQFSKVSEGSNTGYSLFNVYNQASGYPFDLLSDGSGYPCIGKDPNYMGGLLAVPGASGAAPVIGWKSPIAGTVNVDYSFSITPVLVGNTGYTYALFEEGASTPLQSATIAGGVSIGPITGTTSIASGKMLYLQFGPHYLGGSYDHYYDDSHIAFSVTYVPEPSTLMLLTCGLFGLLAYAWKKRK